jgi:methylated-DNA-[protein]-cysteine S-methyltransferase
LSRAKVFARIGSPVGQILLSGDGEALSGLHLGEARPAAGAIEAPDAFAVAEAQLSEYFASERTAFDLPLDPIGTPFQLEVWRAVRGVGYGETTTYGELADRIDRPGAARAVGAANGANPLAIVIPCHRLVGANGDLTGYSGGLEGKRWLLELEATSSRTSSSVV